MRINEILTESVQLDEGPFSSIAKGAGKAIGGVAKGVGAVAGAYQGAKQAFAKGKQAGIDVVAGTGQGADAPEEPADTSAQQINQQGPKGTAPAKTVGGIAKQALQKTAQAMGGQTQDQAGQTLYAQVKSQVNQLDKKGKQRILNLLQKSIQQTPAQSAPTENPVAGAAGNAVKKAVGTKPNQTQQNLAKTGNPVGAVTK
jgi:hypothetical protein